MAFCLQPTGGYTQLPHTGDAGEIDSYSWAKDNKYLTTTKVFGTLVQAEEMASNTYTEYCIRQAILDPCAPVCNIESKAQGMEEIVKDDDTVNP